jgi:hypothetical protein
MRSKARSDNYEDIEGGDTKEQTEIHEPSKL